MQTSFTEPPNSSGWRKDVVNQCLDFAVRVHCVQCKVIPGYPFTRGAYSCRCLRGFEYMHKDGKNWLHGTLIEMEYEKKIRGLFSRWVHSVQQKECLAAFAGWVKSLQGG